MTPANDNARTFECLIRADTRAELMHAVSTLLRTLEPDAPAPRNWTVHYEFDDGFSLPQASVRRRAQ